MPSFVPYLSCDSVSNWYPLTCQTHKKFDHTDAMRASRAIKMLQVNAPKVGDADCYRHGDFPLLLRRIDQLEARLPTQTSTVQVPILNTLGGFKMFNNGATDLAPELYGFYGAPGVDVTKTTDLFLVGDHFSPLRTVVLVGNAVVDQSNLHMLSRQVVQVRVVAGSIPTGAKFVHVHLATPYGVSREIAVPLAGGKKEEAPKPTEGYTLDPVKLTVNYQQIGKKDSYILNDAGVAPEANLSLNWNDALGTAPPMIQVKFTFPYRATSIAVITRRAIKETAGKYVLEPVDLAGLFRDLLDAMNLTGPFSDDINPLVKGLTTTAISVLPVEAGRATAEVPLTGQKLDVTFTLVVIVPTPPKMCPAVGAMFPIPDGCPPATNAQNVLPQPTTAQGP